MEQKLICIIYNYATNESRVVCAILEAELEKTSSAHISRLAWSVSLKPCSTKYCCKTCMDRLAATWLILTAVPF